MLLLLVQIEIESGTDTALKFYTAFYHVLSAPTQFSEVRYEFIHSFRCMIHKFAGRWILLGNG